MNDNVTTSVDDLKKIAPDAVSDLSDDTLQALIDNANLIAIGDEFPETVMVDNKSLPVRDMATRYMALHLACLQNSASGNVTSEKVDVIETHYSDTSKLKWLQRTVWGQAYERLWKNFAQDPNEFYGVAYH